MPSETHLLEQVDVETDRTPVEQVAVEQEAVEQVLKAVLADSRQEPQTFLDETVVPHGGE